MRYWYVTFIKPATYAYSIRENDNTAAAELWFPLLRASRPTSLKFGLSDSPTDGTLSVSRIRRGTLGPLSGPVRISDVHRATGKRARGQTIDFIGDYSSLVIEVYLC